MNQCCVNPISLCSPPLLPNGLPGLVQGRCLTGRGEERRGGRSSPAMKELKEPLPDAAGRHRHQMTWNTFKAESQLTSSDSCCWTNLFTTRSRQCESLGEPVCKCVCAWLDDLHVCEEGQKYMSSQLHCQFSQNVNEGSEGKAHSCWFLQIFTDKYPDFFLFYFYFSRSFLLPISGYTLPLHCSQCTSLYPSRYTSRIAPVRQEILWISEDYG